MRVRTRRTTGMADRLAHAPHLAVAALVDREAQQRRRRRSDDLGRRGEAVVELDALAQPAQRAPATASPSTSARYSFSTPKRRVGEPVGEVAVVGEQQQALGVGVEAPDREHPGLGRHEVDHGRPALRVVGGGDHARPACCSR